MNLEVIWPDAIRQKIAAWGLSSEGQLALIETLDRRLQRCSEPQGIVTQELSLPDGDYYVWMKYTKHDAKIVVVECDIEQV